MSAVLDRRRLEEEEPRPRTRIQVCRPGNLFFTLATLIEAKRPPIALLENVKNPLSHDSGRTWNVIRETLQDLDYVVHATVIDAASWISQHRERIFIVCFDRRVFGDAPPFEFPAAPQAPRPKLQDILEKDPPDKYTLSEHLWTYLQEYARRHKEKGNGFGFGIADPGGVTRTLSARYYKDGSEILISQGKRKPPRRLTPRECARLMGFPTSIRSSSRTRRPIGSSETPSCLLSSRPSAGKSFGRSAGSWKRRAAS